MFAGQPGMFGRAAMLGMNRGSDKGLPTRAQGRFTILTDGEILTNNSEEGPAVIQGRRQLYWDVDAGSERVPEMMVRL